MDLKAVGARVRKLREAAREVQEDLAAICEVSRSTIAGIESGADRGGLVTMLAIADHYKVPLDWLLCRRVPPGGPAVGCLVDRPDQLALLAFWESLSEIERHAAVGLLRIPLPGKVA